MFYCLVRLERKRKIGSVQQSSGLKLAFLLSVKFQWQIEFSNWREGAGALLWGNTGISLDL